MNNSEATKPCFKCNAVLPLSGFYKHQMMADGHLNKCKSCCTSEAKENRRVKLDYYREYDRLRLSAPQRQATVSKAQKKMKSAYPEKYKARRAVAYALRTGKITRLPCEICGTTENVDAHHGDYSKPLDVKWLCRVHHLKEHGRYIEDD